MSALYVRHLVLGLLVKPQWLRRSHCSKQVIARLKPSAHGIRRCAKHLVAVEQKHGGIVHAKPDRVSSHGEETARLLGDVRLPGFKAGEEKSRKPLLKSSRGFLPGYKSKRNLVF